MANQHSIAIHCSQCKKLYIVSFKTSTKRAFIKECIRMQTNEKCSECDKSNPKDKELASRELQISGLSEMYRPPHQKPAGILTLDSGKKEWMHRETKTERALRECSADNQQITVEKFWCNSLAEIEDD